MMQLEREICILPQKKWNSITNWLTERQREEERIARHNEYLKYVKLMSTKLVAGHDSIKEAAAKRIEEKRKQCEGEDKKILKDYLRIKENQKIERDQMMKKYQRHTLITKTPSVELTSALIEAETLGERQKALELRQTLRMKEKEMEEKEMNKLKYHWKITNIQQRKEEDIRKCKLNATKTEVWKQCQDNLKNKQEEYRNQVKEERMHLYRIAEELKTKDKMKREQQYKEKKRNLYLMKKAAQEAEQQRFIEKQQDRELYKVNQVINNALTVRNCHINTLLKEEVKERVDQNVDLYVKYVSQLPPMESSEESIYQNGIRENQEAYEKKMEEKRAMQKKYAEAKIQDYKEDMRRQKLKQEEEAELKRMEMIERYKKTEAMKYLDEINQKDELKQKMNYGKELLTQAEEQKNIRKHEKKLEDEYAFYTYSTQDDRFVEYAEEVIKFAKEKKWPTMPIRKVIENYKKSPPIMQRRRKEIPIGKHSAILKFQEEYTSPKVGRKFAHLESQLQP